MNSIDKISRDSKILIESAKDTVAANMLTASQNNQISVSDTQLQQIMNVLLLSIDEGYQKALPTYQNTIKKHLK